MLLTPTQISLSQDGDECVVLFEAAKDKSLQVQQTCPLVDLIFYETAKEEKIYSDDKVLVNMSGKRRFVPGKRKFLGYS